VMIKKYTDVTVTHPVDPRLSTAAAIKRALEVVSRGKSVILGGNCYRALLNHIDDTRAVNPHIICVFCSLHDSTSPCICQSNAPAIILLLTTCARLRRLATH
jgi:hypothetical protein